MTSPPETVAVDAPLPAGEEANTAGLSAAKRALLLRRLTGTGDPQRRPTISRRPAGTPAPLSSAQRRMWFLEQLEPGTGAFNIPQVLRLRGRLDPDRLEQAWNQVVASHEALRTTFAAHSAASGAGGGEQWQLVADHQPVQLPREDLSHLPAPAREPAARDRAQQDVRRPFDLIGSPLWRIRLIRLGSEDHVLVLVVHHSISDEHSTTVMMTDLAAGYAGGEVPEPPVQYGDVALWQQQRLTAARVERHLAYWRESLAGAPALRRR